MKPRILLIDDDPSLRRVTEYNLSSAGFTVLSAASGREGLALFQQHSPDLVITDVQLGDLDGLQILAAVKKDSPLTPVLVITAFGSIELAVKAMQEGAFTFLAKPFDREALRLSCRKALEMRELYEQKQQLRGEVNRLTGTEGMETANPAMAALLDTAKRAANSEATVLIAGESGTGKEVLARLIHQHSPRAQGSMVAVNCAAIPENLLESELFGHVKGAFTGAVSSRKGRFQSAAGGTLFLDEIGELRLDLQAKLLRAIQERVVAPVGAEQPEAVDVRLIAASNRDLYAAIGQGTFREDLYYRLGVILLHLPPLRERREDIPGLVAHFLLKVGAPAGVRFSVGALAKLKAHHWPGNIRELQNIVERAVILRKGLRIEAAELQLAAAHQSASANGLLEIPDEGLSLEAVEQELIKKAMLKANGNRSEAARLLRIPRHVLIYRLEKFKIL
ncbi:MAG: Fis family transcriptional regulator [Deltaproteobacteria bacterium RIFOXYD12_FULL_56_24]|nr:MAG: Fis family transcriptional regulator [Deltaproteobacteria bacterium RIFOXYD12_FULL_56_24]